MAMRAQKQVHQEAQENAHAAVEASKQTWNAWCHRKGHLTKSGLEKLAREDLVEGFTVDKSSLPFSRCEACIKAKMMTKPYTPKVLRAYNTKELTSGAVKAHG
jgi:hypothetical protein